MTGLMEITHVLVQIVKEKTNNSFVLYFYTFFYTTELKVVVEFQVVRGTRENTETFSKESPL